MLIECRCSALFLGAGVVSLPNFEYTIQFFSIKIDYYKNIYKTTIAVNAVIRLTCSYMYVQKTALPLHINLLHFELPFPFIDNG